MNSNDGGDGNGDDFGKTLDINDPKLITEAEVRGDEDDVDEVELDVNRDGSIGGANVGLIVADELGTVGDAIILDSICCCCLL